jgi:hypothetical protein
LCLSFLCSWYYAAAAAGRYKYMRLYHHDTRRRRCRRLNNNKYLISVYLPNLGREKLILVKSLQDESWLRVMLRVDTIGHVFGTRWVPNT